MDDGNRRDDPSNPDELSFLLACAMADMFNHGYISTFQLRTVKELVRRLRAGGMSDISIRAMLVDQKPVQGPPAGWPPSVTPAQAREMLGAYRERFPDVARVVSEVFGEEEMASDVAEVARGLTHEDELRAERVRLGADEDRMHKGFRYGR